MKPQRKWWPLLFLAAGLCFLPSSIYYSVLIASGDTGTSGGHIFGLVMSSLAFVINFGLALHGYRLGRAIQIGTSASETDAGSTS